MLKTNSKQARQNIREYVMHHFDGCNHGIDTPATFEETAAVILSVFRDEKPAVGAYAAMTEQERFTDWAQGLPSILDTCYYYNRSAVDDLGGILEETENEKEEFDDEAAARLLTFLIYRELCKGERK